MKLMKMSALILLFLFTSILHPQQRYDFKQDSLHLAWGEKNFSGPKDCSASVKLYSDGEFIKIHVDVKDDVLVFNDDPIHSDHVELWFSLPGVPIGPFTSISNTKFVVGDSLLYLINDKADKNKLKLFLDDPLINVFPWVGPDSFYYSETLELDLPLIKESVDEFKREIESSNFDVQNIFLGMVHYGVLPGDSIVFQYDIENYKTIEKFTGNKIDSTSNNIKFNKKITADGYSLDISIPSEGLGFISKTGVKNLKFLVDVIDVDKDGKQESLLSINKERKWGEPNTFKRISLRKPIEVSAEKDFSLLGEIPKYQSFNSDLLKQFHLIFMKSKNGWAPIRIVEKIYEEFTQPSSFTMPNLSVFKIEEFVLDYRGRKVKDTKLEYINTSKGRILIIDSKKFISVNQILEEIILSNGNPAFLYTKFYTSGPYNAQLFSELYLISNDRDEKIAEFIVDYSAPLLKILSNKLESKEWDNNKLKWDRDPDSNINWQNVIVHKNNEQQLILDLGKKIKYRIRWNSNGKVISSAKL